MHPIRIYDPALCCSTGVCGVDVDEALLYFAADLDWLARQGADVERYNLAQQPLAFAENPAVREVLERAGAAALPLVLVGGQVALTGRYPTRTELARWAGLAAAPAVACGADDCGC